MTEQQDTPPQRQDAVRASQDTLWVSYGAPTPEELAAVVLVLSTRATTDESPGLATPRRSGWTDHARNLPFLPAPAYGAWRASGWPR